MSNAVTDGDDDRTTIRSGREFEEAYRLIAADAGEFLIDLGEQLRDSDEVTVTDEEGELPFAFGESDTVEIDFHGVGDSELEVKVELPARPDETAPGIS